MMRLTRFGIRTGSTFVIVLLLVFIGIVLGQDRTSDSDILFSDSSAHDEKSESETTEAEETPLSPMAIQSLRERNYPGGEFTVE